MTLKEKIIKAKKSKSMRTSANWCRYFGIVPADILDPGGWDRRDFEYDFNSNAITYTKFDFKLGQSTCQRTANEYHNCVIELIKNQNGGNGHTDADDSDIASTESEVEIETSQESEPSNGGTSSEEDK